MTAGRRENRTALLIGFGKEILSRVSYNAVKGCVFHHLGSKARAHFALAFGCNRRFLEKQKVTNSRQMTAILISLIIFPLLSAPV